MHLATISSNPPHPCAAADCPQFRDLGGYSWASGAIRNLAAQGIIEGVRRGAFDPGGTITRAQFAALLTRMFDLPPPSQPVGFSDVAASYWAYGAIEATAPYFNFDDPSYPGYGGCSGAKLVGAAHGPSFDPSAPVDRQTMASVVVRILASSGRLQLVSPQTAANVLSGVGDQTSISPMLGAYVATAMQTGILAGFPNGTFQPSANLTRAQTAVLLQRVENGGYSGKWMNHLVPDKSSPQAEANSLWVLGYSAVDAACVLFADWSLSPHDSAQALQAAGYSVSDIGHALNFIYGGTGSQAAQILDSLGDSAAVVGTALRAAFGDSPTQASEDLKSAGYNYTDIGITLAEDYHTSADATALALKALGAPDFAIATALRWAAYGTTDIAQALSSALSVLPQDIASYLQQLGFGVEQVAAGLGALGLPLQTIGQILVDLGYGIDDITSVLSDVFNQTAADIAQLLQDIGYGVDEGRSGARGGRHHGRSQGGGLRRPGHRKRAHERVRSRRAGVLPVHRLGLLTQRREAAGAGRLRLPPPLRAPGQDSVRGRVEGGTGRASGAVGGRGVRAT